jgi:hypothetical protein
MIMLDRDRSRVRIQDLPVVNFDFETNVLIQVSLTSFNIQYHFAVGGSGQLYSREREVEISHACA